MLRYRLRSDDTDINLPDGDFVVGRASDCDFIIDDPMASRRHAMFQAVDGDLWVEDLGSRNGIKVNRTKREGRVKLSEGDVVTVGNRQFVINTLVTSGVATRERARTMVENDASSDGPTVMGVRGELIERSLAVGKVEEAEKILQSFIQLSLNAFAGKSFEPVLLNQLSTMCLRIAEHSLRAPWVDRAVELHLIAERVMPIATVDELFRLARPTRYTVTPTLSQYLEWLKNASARMSPSEKFAVQRIEGLARVLMA